MSEKDELQELKNNLDLLDEETQKQIAFGV